MRRLLVITVGISLFAGSCVANEYATLEFFEREVRPILANRCYECHDGENAEGAANLRLDYGGGWTAGGDSGPAIDTHDAEKSLLLRAVSYDDPDLQMPPKSKLPQREIDVLRNWIAAGAVAPEETPEESKASQGIDIEARRREHWAWQPVERPQVPTVNDQQWPADPLDQFVLAKLEQAKLAPAEPCDPATWLRRVKFDLTGLPPTVEEVREFVADPSPAAREKVVDRLLASPEFGECWAQHWLDLMRFAETKGHEQDYDIPHAWRYRDYVIRAMNANVPYNQFVVEHIAGDLVDPPRVDPETRTNQSIQATGWWHLGEATHSPVDIRGEEANRIDNQIDVFGKALLGMTIACARCHDHKFDAISTADYYALCGFVQSSSYQEANIADPERQQQLAREFESLQQQHAAQVLPAYVALVEQRLTKFVGQAKQGNWTDAQRAELQQAIHQPSHPWHLLAVASEAEGRGMTVEQMIRQAVSETPTSDGPTFDSTTPNAIVDFSAVAEPVAYADWLTSGQAFGSAPQPAGAVLIADVSDTESPRVLSHAAATNLATSPKLTGLYRTRTFEVTADRLWYRVRGKANVFMEVDSHRTVAGPLHGVVRKSIDTQGAWQWIEHPTQDYVGHHVHVDFKPTGEFSLAEVRHGNTRPAEPKAVNPALAQAVRDANPATFSDVLEVVTSTMSLALEDACHHRADEAVLPLAEWLVDHDSLLPEVAGESFATYRTVVDNYTAARTELEKQIPHPQYAIALLDGSSEDEYVHLRGSHQRLAPEATHRRMLTALGGEFPITEGSGRLQLAERVAAADNPLFTRTIVNRLWAHLMGEGIVATVDNLGVLGRRPTHPDLLDYLACEFVDSNWDTKAMIRRMVLSSTYAQRSQGSPANDPQVVELADPANELVHMARVRRVPAEAIRDSLFVIAGELDPKMYGPSVEVEITDFMRNNRSPSGSGPMDGDRRRSIYVKVRRNALNHFLAAFDKPMPFTTVGHRNCSNSAAQPLMLLNDPLVHHLVDKWAEKLTAQFADDSAAIEHAYLSAFARPASAEETAQITAFLAEQASANVPRADAWQDVCLALVNSKEFIFLK
ncbi:PSD1 and planctomycete cytochrome C domain-containing protein [Aeoliella mucimassa]|uniref:Planctomycete cytochrome C n=1 Tax=Aeoliella mucimassa TaxID=2527972 RepID=A0A518AHG0_9BACT|nr:PSD1 and planctomycete cytochrome C domain-containing protein [Aeoliella mucimassa]QDU54152.1 Planctomycete cytochrome C [Aeoliella mucimassa]